MIFIDAGAFIALYLRGDQYHKKSLETWQRIEQENLKCFTSNLVLREAVDFIASRAGHSFSIEKARNIYHSQKFTVLRSSLEDEVGALHLYEKYATEKIGFTDCISFVLMQKARIKTAFSFDKHFEYAGFELIP